MPERHHEHGPSSLDFKAVCPGFMKDKDADDARAKRGQLLHKARETGDLSLCPTEEDAQYVKKCIDYIAKVKAQMPDCIQLDEHEVQVAGGATFGTGDCYLISADTTFAHYFDTKFAWKKQAPLPNNFQMKSYGPAGIMNEYPRMNAVKVHLLYPQLDIVETHTYFRKDKAAIELEIKTVLARIEYYRRTGDSKVLCAKDGVCDNCGRLGACTKVAEWLYPMVRRYSDLPVVSEVHASRVANPDLNALQYYEVADLIEKMGASAKKHLKELAMASGGFKDAQGNVIAKAVLRGTGVEVTDSVKFCEIFKELGVSSDEIIAFSKIKVTDLVDHIAKLKAPKRGKTKYVDELMGRLHDECAIQNSDPITVIQKVKAVDIDATVVTP